MDAVATFLEGLRTENTNPHRLFRRCGWCVGQQEYRVVQTRAGYYAVAVVQCLRCGGEEEISLISALRQVLVDDSAPLE